MTDPITAALDRLQEYAAAHPEHDTHEIVQRARAALAEPADAVVPEERSPVRLQTPAPADPQTDPVLRHRTGTMTDPIRALCAEMAAELDHICQCLLDDRTLTNPLANRARALLAADGPAVPEAAALAEPLPADYIDPEHSGTDREMLKVFYSATLREGGTADEICLRGINAVLARWGNHSADASKMVSPAECEVTELVAWLTGKAEEERYWCNGGNETSLRFARIAELLERQAAPVPVPEPVAIPGEHYHDDMGPVTWWRLPVEEPPWVGTPNDSDWPGYHTHFTPGPPEPALPLPAQGGEVG